MQREGHRAILKVCSCECGKDRWHPHLEPFDDMSTLGILGGWCHTFYTICFPDSQVCPQLSKFSYIMYTRLKWLLIIFTKEFELTFKLNNIHLPQNAFEPARYHYCHFTNG